MPFAVVDGLSFGNISDAASALTSEAASPPFTHVLSLLSSTSVSFFSEWSPGLAIVTADSRATVVEAGVSPRSALPAGHVLHVRERAGPGLKVQRMAVAVRDTEDEDLLDFLEGCLGFIDEGRKEGRVLVHCFAGVSRSAAVVTAYLMRTGKKPLEDALESLKHCCEHVCPNDGFLDQLKLFEEMGFKVDTSSPLYKRFRLKILGHSYKVGIKLDSSLFESDPEQYSAYAGSNETERKKAYRCKKCRKLVALQDNIVSHVPGEGEFLFDRSRKSTGKSKHSSQEQECSSLFVEPLQWMSPAVEEGALEGKLSCIHCDSRLGYFNWSGIQCNCGSWITPAFQIHKSKVDVSTT